MDWWRFVETFVAVLVGGGLLTAYFQHHFKKKEKKEEEQTIVKYLALRLAFLFEGYAVECANMVANHKTAIESDQHAGALIAKVPEISDLPLEEGHKLLDQGLINDIFDFPQRCIMANRAAMFWEEVVGDRDCCTNALATHTIDMGAKAMAIGKRLRKQYHLPSRQLGYGEFDMENFLEHELEKLKEHEERIKKQQIKKEE